MAKSLNPNATDSSSGDSGGSSSDSQTADDGPHRRSFFVAFAAGAIGFVLSIFPVVAGALVVLDPLLGKKKKKDRWLRVATRDSIPADGTPIRVPVIADLVDGWNREPNQPIGAVYLRREGKKIIAFNAICPHAGCFVNYASQRNVFQCPCHTSSFTLDGARADDSSPSPRDMDSLKVVEKKVNETVEVWVEFVNYYPGKSDRVEKA